MLFQRFDHLLLLSRGKTIYFGDIGDGAYTLIDYFMRNGAHNLPPGANPAEYMLDVIGAAPGATTDIDWPDVWRGSPEYQKVQQELMRLATDLGHTKSQSDSAQHKQFAASSAEQYRQGTKRVFEQYWRSPGYIIAKITMSVGTVSVIILSSGINWDTEISLVTLHRAVVLKWHQHATGTHEPAVWYFHFPQSVL